MAEPRELTEKQAKFLEALFGEANGDYTQAMKLAGYANPQQHMMVMKPLREEIIERATMMLAANAPKAAFKLGGLLDNPTELGAKEIVSVAREILDRVGIVKVDKQELKVEAPHGLFFLPAKNAPQPAQEPDGED